MSRSSADVLNSLTVYDCISGKPVQTLSQSAGEEGFGNFSLDLSYGKHELLFLGHKTEEPTFSYPAAIFKEVHDTFSKRVQLTVGENTESTKTVQLSRSVALVKVVATDRIPENVSALRMTLSDCYNTIDLTNGCAAGQPSSAVRTFTYSSSHLGMQGTTYSIYSFVPNEGFSTTVTLEALDTNGEVVSTFSVSNISVERNHQTILTGELFSTGEDFSVEIDNEWLDDISYPIG